MPLAPGTENECDVDNGPVIHSQVTFCPGVEGFWKGCVQILYARMFVSSRAEPGWHVHLQGRVFNFLRPDEIIRKFGRRWKAFWDMGGRRLPHRHGMYSWIDCFCRGLFNASQANGKAEASRE